MKSEEEKKQDNIDLQQDAKNLVLQELEKNGVINYMRAKIKKSVLDIINKQKDSTKQKLEFDFMTPLHRLNKTKEILIACHLIKDFLKFYELDYTFPIFENESNVKENIKRETLFKECKLKENKEEPKPILLQLVIEQLERKETPIQNNTNSLNNGPQDRYNFSNFSSVYNNPNKTEEEIKNNYSNPIIPGKVQLTPISFTQKSVDINNDSSNKFNTLNISDVYKRDNNTNNNNNNINNNNENKEITAQDILNKGRRKNNNDDINLNNNNNNDNEFYLISIINILKEFDNFFINIGKLFIEFNCQTIEELIFYYYNNIYNNNISIILENFKNKILNNFLEKKEIISIIFFNIINNPQEIIQILNNNKLFYDNKNINISQYLNYNELYNLNLLESLPIFYFRDLLEIL